MLAPGAHSLPLLLLPLLLLPPSARAAEADARGDIVEFTLKDLRGENAREIPSLAETPRAPDCGLCADRTVIVEPRKPPSSATAGQSQLHRLHRDIVEQHDAGEHGREHQVEDTVERLVRPSEP